MNKEEKRINYLLDTIIECPSMQADELRKRIRRLFKTIDKQEKEIEEKSKKYVDLCFEAGKIKADLDIAERVIDKMAEKLSNTMTKSAYEVNWNNDYANGQVYMKKEKIEFIKNSYFKEIENE